MKRDLDLLRRILLDIEAQSEAASWSGTSDEHGKDPQTLHYHVQLLHDAGLIVADELVPGQWWPERMTWAGHEFLDLARNDAVWRATKSAVEDKVGSAPFGIVRELLARNVRDTLDARPSRKK